MLNLMLELLLVFIIAALIGWLMGRYLCKSGEYEQRSQNKQHTKNNQLLQTQLDKTDKDYQFSLEKINHSEAQLVESQQQVSTLKGQLGVMQAEREEHLQRLQETSQCESSLNALIKDFELEKQQLHKQKEKNIELRDQIDHLVHQSNKKEKDILSLQKQLQTKTVELSNTTKAYEDQANELGQLQLIAEQQKKIIAENEQLHSKMALTQDESKTLKSRLQQSNEAHAQLQEKCTQLSEESLGFAAKLEALNDDKNELSRLIETMTIEKNDYLGRLRAISSVVDVVGTEVIEDA